MIQRILLLLINKDCGTWWVSRADDTQTNSVFPHSSNCS